MALMSDDLLFPAESVAMDSPRLRWTKKHDVRVFKSSHAEPPWCAWLPNNEHEIGGIPSDLDACGYGLTEEEALRDLSVIHKIPCWNKE